MKTLSVNASSEAVARDVVRRELARQNLNFDVVGVYVSLDQRPDAKVAIYTQERAAKSTYEVQVDNTFLSRLPR